MSFLEINPSGSFMNQGQNLDVGLRFETILDPLFALKCTLFLCCILIDKC